MMAYAAIGLFLLVKIFNLSLRFGDGNAYLYMAKMLTEGVIPYRDFFFADPPFLVLLLSGFRMIFGDQLLLYQLVPVFFEAGTAFLLYLILKKWKIHLAYLAPLFYLFSFTVLSTSDYITGVQIVVFFMSLGIYLYEKEKPIFSGLAWSLAVLTKIYAAPAVLGWLIYLAYKKEWENIWKVVIGGLLGLGIVLGPFLFISFEAVIHNLILHQLGRPQGINKSVVMLFFVKQEWFFIFTTIVGLYLFRKKIVALPFVFLVCFFLIFPDIYYTYLDTFMPFIVIIALLSIDKLWKNHRDIGVGIFTVYFFFILFSFFNYFQNYVPVGKFTNHHDISGFIETLPENAQLYGSHEVAPLIALQSHRKLFHNYIDTNSQAFSSGAQNIEKVSEEAVESGVYLLGRVSYYPQWKIDNGTEGYFSQNILRKYCHEVKKFPSTSREIDNYIKIYWCKKS